MGIATAAGCLVGVLLAAAIAGGAYKIAQAIYEVHAWEEWERQQEDRKKQEEEGKERGGKSAEF